MNCANFGGGCGEGRGREYRGAVARGSRRVQVGFFRRGEEREKGVPRRDETERSVETETRGVYDFYFILIFHSSADDRRLTAGGKGTEGSVLILIPTDVATHHSGAIGVE